MKAVILAAGFGSRLGAGIPKILLELDKRTFLEYHLDGLRSIGIKDVIVIAGYKKELVAEHIDNISKGRDIRIEIVENEKFDVLQNGYSVYCAKGHVDSEFLMLMGDHLIDYSILRDLVAEEPKGFIEVIDSDPKYTSIEQATKIRIEDGMLVESDKKLIDFNGLDTGYFILPPDVFAVLEENEKKGMTEWNDCVQHFIALGKVTIFDIKGSFWHGVNTQEEFENVRAKVKDLGL